MDMVAKYYGCWEPTARSSIPISRSAVCSLASMLQARLVVYLDDRTRARLRGFRKNHSTSQPTHILRHLPEMHEHQTSSSHTLFLGLGWSFKAFASLTLTAVRSAPPLVAIPNRAINPIIIERDSGRKSEVRPQTMGPLPTCSPAF